MTPDDIAKLAQKIAGEEIGGHPPRCTGHKADRYNAAYNAVVKAIAALCPQGLETKESGCTCQRYPTHQANDCPTHGLDEPTYTAGERVDAGSTPSQREDGAFVVENTDGKFVASFSTKFLADFFVDDGGGCYRHRQEGGSHG